MRHLQTISEWKGYSKMCFLKHVVCNIIIPYFVVWLFSLSKKWGRTSRFESF